MNRQASYRVISVRTARASITPSVAITETVDGPEKLSNRAEQCCKIFHRQPAVLLKRSFSKYHTHLRTLKSGLCSLRCTRPDPSHGRDEQSSYQQNPNYRLIEQFNLSI